ncbi:hypothetical protein RHGRI_001862 [Rhododendron griersonianum]|uniref:CCHC-type domain-containing protein n=1 Tax=Rhododendron griersonianum TaxID=479676 RepID=A0AAV6LLM7_9ERIC|nr:hypothetical protein RHGRI_001862 [Rhododendron griersonianum]
MENNDVPERTQPSQPSVDRMERIEQVLEGLLHVVNQQAQNNLFKRQNVRTSRWSQGESSSNISGFQPCPKRRRMYRARYYKDTEACFKCGKMGHLMRDCLKVSRAGFVKRSTTTISSRSTSKPMVITNSGQSSGTKLDPGKRKYIVLTLMQEELQNVDLMVSGTIQICGNLA